MELFHTIPEVPKDKLEQYRGILLQKYRNYFRSQNRGCFTFFIDRKKPGKSLYENQTRIDPEFLSSLTKNFKFLDNYRYGQNLNDDIYLKSLVLDSLFFETAIEKISENYGGELRDLLNANNVVVGPRFDTGQHYQINNFHFISLPHSNEFVSIDRLGRKVNNPKERIVARAIHECFHLIISKKMNLPGCEIDGDNHRPFFSSAQNVFEEAVCMAEELKYLKEANSAEYNSLLRQREQHRAWLKNQMESGRTDFSNEIESRYSFGMMLLERINFTEANPIEVIEKAKQFLNEVRIENPEIRTLFDIPIDTSNKHFQEFMNWMLNFTN